MTDVLDRLDAAELPPYAEPPAVRPDDLRPRVAIAALATGAAAIHLAMVPAHFGEWTLEGAGFVAAAWIQLLVAFLAVTRPAKRLWWLAIASNAAFVVAWIVSRTSGFPFGPQKDIAEDLTIVDGLCVLFEIAVIFGALAMLLLPPRMRAARGWLLGAVVPLAVLGLTTTVLASPSARNHGDHAHAGAVALPASMVNRGFGSFMNGHSHTHVNVPLDPGTQKQLDHQLAITRELADEYPTLQDAVDAGYRRAGPYVPGLGTHMIKFEGEPYINPDGALSDEDLRHPLSLLYLGTDADSKLGGFMYYAATSFEPEGFVGRNDSWHYHEDLCAVMNPDGLLDFPFGPDFGATKAQCDSVKGNLLDSQYMVHVWTVPGWDDMDSYGGVFAETNPGFGCSDGTWFSLPANEWIDHLTNVCRNGEAGQPDY